jgi:hypothetical protein
MLDEFDVTATFCVVADVVDHYPGLVESIVSVNSLYNKTDSSLEGVSSHPYYPQKNSLGLEIGEEKGKKIVEFPWAYWNVFGFKFNFKFNFKFKIPTSGGPMLRFLGAHVILKGLNQSLKRGQTVFYFHPIDISNEKFPAVGKGRPLYWIVKGKLVEKRIRYILKNLKDVNKVCLREALGQKSTFVDSIDTD